MPAIVPSDEHPIRSFILNGQEVIMEADWGPFTALVTISDETEGVAVASIHLESLEAAEPPEITLRWSVPSIDIAGQWTTWSCFNKSIDADWQPSMVESKLAANAPVMTLFGNDDSNRFTFAVSDGLNTTQLSSGIREEDGQIVNSIRLFGERHPPVRSLCVEIRFDIRPISYSEALAAVSEWWASKPGYAPASVPGAALFPMYSTWYSYHQKMSSEALLKEIRIGKSIGLKSIIIDDGWQTEDSNRGYAYTGDWRPEGMPDIARFIDCAHAEEVNVLLWYAVPLIGEKSEIFKEFQGKFLQYRDGQDAYEIDPRYPEVREYIVRTYREALKVWGVDGFKLDFIGRFVANRETVLQAVDGRDFASVNDAADRLMSEIIDELRKIKPDIMIEFRQPYIGPLMRKYGNMFRAGDVPGSAVANRVRTVDLRLLSGKTAVHSDMFMWHHDEGVSHAARQFLNVLFSVPQVSLRLGDIAADHLQMLKHYLRYWTENREVLMNGGFHASSPLANYPVVQAWKNGIQIIGVYQDAVVRISSARGSVRIDILNGTSRSSLVIDSELDESKYEYHIRDVLGAVVHQGSIVLGVGVHAFDVPASGMISFNRL